MIIEWHTHVYPHEEAGADTPAWRGKDAAMWGGKCPMTLENVLDAHERTEINVTIVSNAAHYLRDRSQADLIKAIRLWSDYAAEIQRDNKGKLYCFATALPCEGPEYIREPSVESRSLT